MIFDFMTTLMRNDDPFQSLYDSNNGARCDEQTAKRRFPTEGWARPWIARLRRATVGRLRGAEYYIKKERGTTPAFVGARFFLADVMRRQLFNQNRHSEYTTVHRL